MVELHTRALATTSSDVVISTDHLVKTYQYHRQQAGLVNALKSLVHREYQTRVAVKGIDLAVRRGEVVGLLGPNGAGKTTTLKMLTGLLRPSDGAVSVLGFQPWQRETEFLRRIALVMGQKSMLWWDVSAMESLLLHKDMYGLDEATFRESVDELAELLDVRQHLDIQVRRLSLGERMKLELMVALVHRPEVLFLDEPTIGLDVVAKARVRTFLADVNRHRGTTIVITSHDMDDIEALCQRVMIMTQGEIEYDGDLTQLVRTTQPRKRIRVVFGGPVDLETVRTQLPDVDVKDRTEDHSEAVVMIESPRDVLSETLSRLPLLGPVIDIDVSDTDIDEIIRELFTRRSEAEVSP
ncbi:MAG: ATP-binding cassette domain-containing protein [Thermomicrobiales bacterium]